MTTLHLRKSIGRSPLRRGYLLIPLALCCLSLAAAQAVSPAPDGGYPGGNTAEGQSALFSLTTGGYNTAVGFFSLKSDTVGSFNIAIGAGALFANSADNNTATGVAALLSNTNGMQNTADGAFALSGNTIGGSNTALGYNAGTNITGNSNICIGAGVTSAAGESNTIRIGDNLSNVTGQSSCYIGGIWAQPADPQATLVVIDVHGKLGQGFSSRRFKHDIKPMGKASEALLALKPVTFHYKSDAKSTPCFGLIAEDVEKVNPDLVVRDKEGKPLSVRYDQVNAMLLNEFLKQHRKVQEQETTIAQLKQEFQSRLADQQKQIKALASSLQEVSNQVAAASPSRGGVEMSKAGPSVVLNNP